MKRIFTSILILLFVLSTAACSNDHSQSTSNESSYVDPISDYDDISVFFPTASGDETFSEPQSNESANEGSETAISEEPPESSDDESFGNVTSEEEFRPTGGIIVKQKKYDYNGNHVVIMTVENQTKQDYTITIKGSYFEANGTMIQQENKTFKGFASGYQNYFIFNPGMQFDLFEYTLTTESFDGIAFSKYLKTMDPVRITTGKTFINGTGGFFDKAHVAVSASFQVANTYDKELFYSAEFVVFDNKGGIYYIDSTLQESSAVPVESGRSPTEYRIGRYIIYTDVLWEDKSSFVLPDELQGDVIGIVCVKSISN